jgi:tetratricopeptide (TPR) repeat protein
MAFDKAKVVRAAEKFLAQGKIPAAIKEYRQIVEHDTGDFTALNMLGDLYVRQNDKQQAIQCFLRIAEHYREEGFQSKAIAMYKKIDRLNPRSPEIANKLAVLYESQGLVVDARAQYMIIAEAWLRDGQSRKALEILRKVADLEPHNTETRIKLAQGYMREGMPDEAAEAFRDAGAQLLARGVHERAAEAYTSSLDIRPLDYSALSGFLQTQIALGTPDEAAEVLERAQKERPDDVELLSMLADAYLEAEDAGAAERTVNTLVTREVSHYMRFVDVARLHLKAGAVDDAVRVLSSITEQMLSGREEDKLMELLNEVLARDPEHVEALRLLVRFYAWQRDDEKQRQALERLAEAAEAAGLPDVERSALQQLAQFAPDQRHLARLQALGFGSEHAAQEVAPQPEPEPEPEEIPSFESFALINEEPATASAMGLPPNEGVAEFEFNAVAPPAPDPSSSFADLNEDWNPAGESTASLYTDATQVDSAPGSFQEFDFSSGGGPASSAVAGEEAGAASGEADPRREALLRQELDSVDFYLAQGYMDIAADTLDMLERQFGTHTEISSRRAKLGQAAPTEPADAQPAETVQFESFTTYDVAEEVPVVEESSVEVDEIFAEVQAAPPATEPPPAAPSSALASEQPRSGIDPGLAAIFDEFRTAAEEEETPSADGDYETHYNLGIAYKEMELLDEAVEQFQAAAALTSPRDGTPRYLQCCNMLGHCFMSKGMPRLAVMWFKKGLEAPGHTEDEYQALRYDLGTSYEQLGELDKAIDVFSEVYGISISYRGVAEKLRELQEQKASQ